MAVVEMILKILELVFTNLSLLQDNNQIMKLGKTSIMDSFTW